MTAPSVASSPSESPALRRITGAEWDRLVAESFFGPEERVELVNGRIVEMSPVGDVHSTVVKVLARVLGKAYGAAYHVATEQPFDVHEERLYPDVAVIRGREELYLRRTPEPRKAPLIVEVVDTTGSYERGEKSEVYARGGVAEYWIVDVNDRTVEVRRQPRRQRGVYSSCEIHSTGSLEAPACRRRIAIKGFLGLLGGKR